MRAARKMLIADDHAIVRSGIKLLLKEVVPAVEIIESGSGDEVIVQIKATPFDLIILDVNMPETDSFTLLWNILAYRPNARVLVFSVNSSSLYAKRFLNLGAMGYLQKDVGQEEVKKAVLTIISGGVYRSAPAAMTAAGKSETENSPFEKLSDRELQVARCVLMGYSYNQMEKLLHLQSSTIATHKFRLYKKLAVGSLAELVKLACKYDFDGRLSV
jgi:two-component system invasion response regulator UvrY